MSKRTSSGSKKLDRRWVVQLKYELTPTNIILRRQQSASSADWNPLISPGWKTPFQAATSKVSPTCAARFACRWRPGNLGRPSTYCATFVRERRIVSRSKSFVVEDY